MKLRILSCFLIFALCFSMLSACGSDTAPSDHSPNSSLQTEISDSQDSTPVESSETDPAGTSDDDSSEGEAEPSQVVESATSPDQQAESSAPAEITTASRFSTSDVPAYPTCSSVNDMKEKNRQEFFGTRDESIALGYSPCGRCKP